MKKIASLVLLAAVFAASCKKDNNNNDNQSIGAYLGTFDQQTQNISFAAQTGINHLTSRNIRLYIAPNSFADAAGNTVTGYVDLRIKNYISNADLLFGHMSTATADSTLLVTGGMFHISVSANGQPLHLAPGKEIGVRIPAKNNTLDPGFSIFRGTDVPQDSNRVQWTESNVKWVGRLDSTTAAPFYYFTIPDLNWWNLDHYPDLGNGKTKVSVTMPAGYTNINTMVMLLMPDNGGIFLPGDQVAQNFNTGNYYAPIGEQVKLVCISNYGGSLQYYLQTMTVTGNMNVTVTSLQSTTGFDLLNLVNGL